MAMGVLVDRLEVDEVAARAEFAERFARAGRRRAAPSSVKSDVPRDVRRLPFDG